MRRFSPFSPFPARLSCLRARLFTLLLLCLILCLLPGGQSVVQAQTVSQPITISAEAGFAGYFEPERWFPLRVGLTNEGEDVAGQVVVRPETSGAGIPNTFSTPLTLPAGGQQTVQMAISARAFADSARVEVLNEAGVVLASTTVRLTPTRPDSRLVTVLSESAVGSVDLTGASPGVGEVHQADWSLDAIPDNAAPLAALDLMLFHDADTAALRPAQVRAIEDWVIGGGHLVVAGGAGWAGTAAGLRDLLPFQPGGTANAPTLAGLADWLRLGDGERAALAAATPISTGDVREGATVLAQTDDGQPLLIRRTLGGGVVDYLTADPGAQPLRGWANLAALWAALQTTRPPLPSWTGGMREGGQAMGAAGVLPGFDPLPDTALLFGFLLLYIALIGPLNYLLLRQINRREWAWFTMPALIVVFTIAAYAIGSQLRGNVVTLNRLAAVAVYPQAERAPAEGVVGLLSPRRATYTLAAEGGAALRPIPADRTNAGTLLARDVQGSVNIAQLDDGTGDGFAARDFAVDASFIAPFEVQTWVDAPEVAGTATLAYDLESGVPGMMVVRGSVANNTEWTITDGVWLARGVAERLPAPLPPGEIATFEIALPGTSIPAPVPYLPSPSFGLIGLQYQGIETQTSVQDILGIENYDADLFTFRLNRTPERDRQLRRQQFLASLVDDSFGSTGRGDNVYFVGFTDSAPIGLALEGAEWNAQAETALLVQLATTATPPPGERVTVSGDRFSWVLTEFQGIGEVSPVDLRLQPGESAAFQFTPVPTAALAQVDELRVTLDELSSSSRTIPAELWNWAAGAWEAVDITAGDVRLNDPARFLGVQNAVRLRVTADAIGGYLRVGQVRVEQTRVG